jgi:hypothetical protein
MKNSPRLLIVLITMLLAVVAVAGQPTKSKSTKKKSAPASETAPAPAIAAHPFRVDGVEVALLEVTRSAPTVVTVRWEYRNHNATAAELAADSKGWSDPYRLSWDTYVLMPDGKTKVGVLRDSDRRPISGLVGKPNQLTITVPPKKTLATWARYEVPGDVSSVTVGIAGADPFENAAIKEPQK